MPTIPDTDLSGQLLDNIFGVNWEQITSVSTIPEGAAKTFIFPILESFNTVVLAATTIMLLFTFFQGTIGTASEGKPLGRRFSSKWVPIRGALGISFLIPIAKISILQIILLTCISWSINFANEIWENGLEYLADHCTLTTESVTEGEEDIQDLAAGILKNLIVQDYYDIKLETGYGSRYTEDDNTDISEDQEYEKYYVFSPPAVEGDAIKKEDMGKVTIRCVDPESDLCTARQNAVDALISDLESISRGIVSINTESSNEDVPSDSYFNQAVINYKEAVAVVAGNYISTCDTELKDEIEEFLNIAKEQGWLSAGFYYWNIAGVQSKIKDEMSNCPTVTSCNKEVYYAARSYDQLEEYIDAGAEAYCKHQIDKVEGTPGSDIALSDIRGITDIFKYIGQEINDKFSDDIVGWFVDKVSSSDQDMVTNLADVGHRVLFASETLLGLSGATSIAKSTLKQAMDSGVGFWAKMIPGIGETKDGIKGAVIGALGFFSIVAFALAVALYPLGFSLAFYLPAVPFLLWMMTVLNWLILVLESIIAASLWAAAHAMPHGEGFVGDHGKQGYFLFLNILIRPSLMLAGLLISIIILTSVGGIIGLGFKIFNTGMLDGRVRGVPTALSMIFLFGWLTVIFAHKIFGLIMHFPDNAMRWFYQHIPGMGETLDLEKIKGGFSSTVRHQTRFLKGF